ncbi:MAG: Cof-type HAD-IIB family hydrolase [Clostridia bacterium]|nr:Cof-type HAD-IIB family hydrolase [Clostridia bacterium]
MVRLIAMDLDDTLLNADCRVTERTKAALKKAMDAGCYVTLASGRMTDAMLSTADAVEINAPMVCFNGALIYDKNTDRTLYKQSISESTARQIAKKLEELGIYTQTYPGKGYYCNKRSQYTEPYEKAIGVNATELGVPLSGWITGEQIKMLAIDTPERICEVQKILQETFPLGACFMRSKPHYLEIVAENVDKGAGLKKLSELMNVDIAEVAAFGDGQNDVSMIRAAGIGVAMLNGAEECKKAAKIIAPRNTEDGVAQVVEEWFGSEEEHGTRG